MTYSYYEESNKLKNVDGSTTENYTYDEIGNLVSDTEEGITNIDWTPYGKVRKVVKDDNSEVQFRYDASGNRIAKITETDTTIYVRDASGNVMGVYNNKALKEQAIYGSSRLGLVNYASKTGYRSLGGKKYELTNHLGNVLAVVSDNIHLDQDSTWTTAINTTDYYPFGLAMDGRTVQDSTYRYGFNGKEQDSAGEWGSKSHYDYGFRIYKPSIAKFLSVDPLTADYPWYTPYQFAGNKPVWAVDLDGLEELIYTEQFKKSEIGQSVIEIASEATLQKEFYKALKSQNKYDVYVGSFNSSITDFEGNVQSLKIKSGGHPASIGAAKGYMFEVKNMESYNKLRKTSYAFNSIQGVENDKIAEEFNKGKGFLFVIVADQMMNPSNNTKSTNKSTDFLNNAIRNATNTYIHESWSHGLPYLKNESYQPDYKEEHKNYHGNKTTGSPSVEEYDKNPSAYETTNFGKNMKEIDKNIK
ncbi:RHS repeat domain-containing protein [Cyclobacterium plantarum]|uniref:RHS repeat domain-containing protein n=1 Tax=Cyclobacterium plantarum TaxID=2716263 RepID=UPI003F71E219